jgi:hypothetical protein
MIYRHKQIFSNDSETDSPITIEDLYGPIDYKYYSYERNIDNTFFLSKNAYRQDSPPEKDAPPRIEYELLETKFDFVYNIAKKHVSKISYHRWWV